ncbi:hypothetical protein E1B28_012913 [Marasmius oreades]|uniref:Zn(2)-C6 fungal-type domain-containing protein n=1 Tax=Marasmius oreades TaxID=181124 RepID=A0A9P7UP76_9AGAR|nr:uncharacterized protein E1B28_012913 [Marasmius oreades]KAG7088968.1 hypothetical protein E1B28_012913 [Marasmius oreades]
MSDTRTCSRPIQSCFQCRKRKIKCNREYPCAPCILRGESEVCREVDRSAGSSGKTTIETLDDVLNRVAVLEKIVSRLSKFLPPDLLLSLTSSIAKPVDRCNTVKKLSTPLTPHVGKSSPGRLPTPEGGNPSGVRFLCGSASSDEEIAMMLEDFAMGNRINRHRASLELLLSTQPSASMALDYPWPATATTNLCEHGFQSHPTGPLSVLIDPSTNVMQRLVSMLPDEPQSRELIQFYFDRIEWYTKIFHYPSFMAEANELFQQINQGSYLGSDNYEENDVWSVGHISISFLSTLFMVICLALHLIEPEICQRLNIGIEEAAALAQTMYSAAQASLWVDNFWSNHSLEAVQCLLLMGVYHKNLDDADSHWALLGSAIKIAQNLGLARLGSENENRVYTGPWKSIVRREIGRRVWWNLIFNDWSHAAAHNGVYSIHPTQNLTGMPANVNDADLVDGREVPGPENYHHYTEMTFSLTRFQFVEIHREIIDNNNTNANAMPVGISNSSSNSTRAPGYGFVTETDAKLQDMLDRIPSRFQHTEQSLLYHPIKQETMGVREMETLMALIMGETRRMRLHRPYLYRGYVDRKYAGSTEQCIDSARAVLHYLKSTPEQSAIFLKWWLVMFYGFGAAVVLFIDLCHLRSENPAAVESRKVELQEALNLFKMTQNASTVSQNAIALLEEMLVVSEPRTLNTRKRASEGNDSMERIAKRTMVESHISGSSSMTASSIENHQGTVGTCDISSKTDCRPSYDHIQAQAVAAGRVYTQSLPPHSQPYPDLHSAAQWYQSPVSPTSNEWNALEVEQASQGMFFGPEFDEAAINELGQLLWTVEPSSGTPGVRRQLQNPKMGPLADAATATWVYHNQNTY